MSKAEEFIKSKIRIGSNTSSNGWRRKGVFIPSCSLPWLTPDDVRKAVEIAREEMIEWIDSHWREYINVDADGVVCFGHWKNDLRKAMENE